MPLNFTSDIMSLFASKVGNDANYQSPGNFGLSSSASGLAAITSVTITAAGTYTVAPTLTPASGAATFAVTMKLLAGTTLAAAGTGYTPGDVLTLSGGTSTQSAQVTVATAKLISATINAGGTGYGVTQTFTATIVGGTNTVVATVSVTSSAGGIVTVFNSVTAAGNYTVLPTLTGAATTGGTGTGLTLNLVFGINTFTVTRPGVYSVLPANAVATTGGGSGGTLTGSWGVLAAAVTAGGSYTTAPVVTFSAGAATGTAVLGAVQATLTDEQKLLMLVEVIRSYIAETNNTIQMKDMNETFRNILSGLRFGSPTTFTAATFATAALNRAMGYIAKNPKRTTIAN